MTPAAWATKEVLEQRRDAFVKSVSTSHWPHLFVRGGFALPNTPDKDPSLVSPGQRRLIGFDRPAEPAPPEGGCQGAGCSVS